MFDRSTDTGPANAGRCRIHGQQITSSEKVAQSQDNNRHADRDQAAVPAAGRHPLAYLVESQPDIERKNKYRATPGADLHPHAVCKLAHPLAVAREVDQWNHRKRQLQIQQNLAVDNQLVTGCVTRQINRQSRGRNRKQTGHQTPQPGLHAELQETFHHDLTSHGARQRRGLSRAKQRRAEEKTRGCCSQQRSEKRMRLVHLGNYDAMREEDSRRHDEDGGVHE